MVFINCAIASIKKHGHQSILKTGSQSWKKVSRRYCVLDDYLLSNSLEEKDLSAYNLKKVIHTKAEGNSVT